MAIAAVLLLSQPGLAVSVDVVIDEPFDGPSLSQNLEGSGFIIAGGVIRRDGVAHESERRYIRTVESDYIHRDFTYELTLRTTPIGYTGIDFVGIGEGVGSGQFREPQNSVHFRIHSTNIAAGVVSVSKRETSTGTGTGTVVGNLLADGTHRVRIEKAGDELAFSIDRSYSGAFSPDFTYTIPSISSYAPFLDHTNSRLFFGTAVAEHSFDDLRITFDPKRLVGGSGNIDDLLLQTMVTDTGPLTGARVVRVVENAHMALNLREIETIESGTGMNVALSGTATQSSSPWPTLVASNVNNGNLDPRDVNHTAQGIGEWVKIELDGQKDLEQLILYNRTDCCQERAHDVQVQVFADVAETDLLFDERVYGLDKPPYQKEVALLTGGTATGSLDSRIAYQLELDGDAGTSDRIVVPQGASDTTVMEVGGILNVSLLSGTLAEGQQYQLLVADRFLGTFDSVGLPDLPPGLAWDSGSLLENGTISVVPEPSTLALLGMGAFGLLAYAWRKRKRA